MSISYHLAATFLSPLSPRESEGYLTPEFSCKHSIPIAAKPHPKSACQLQRSLGRFLGCNGSYDLGDEQEQADSRRSTDQSCP